MVLVDTSVWIRHLRQSRIDLIRLLEQNIVVMHPLVIGELACGRLRRRHMLIEHWLALPRAVEADFDEVLSFIEHNRLFSRGIGMVDMHLLASALIGHCKLLTDDARLRACAAELGVAA